MLRRWKCNVWAIISQEQQLGEDCKVEIRGQRRLVVVQKSFVLLNCKWEGVCPSRINGQMDGIWLLVPSMLWSFGPWGCIPTRVVWPYIPCMIHPTERATSYGVSTISSTIAMKILQIIRHSGLNAYWIWVQWMEPPIRPRTTSFHEFHSVGGQSDMESDIEEATNDNFFGMGPNISRIRAWSMEDERQREVFCQNLGGHWDKKHKRFFRIPEEHVDFQRKSMKEWPD